MNNFVLCLVLMLNMVTGKSNLTETKKIDILIQYVHDLKDVKFIRNGTEYSSVKAAEHLELKREKAGADIKTARQFIKEIGSVSSMTGQPYLIKYSNGKTIKCETLLLQYLDKIEKG